MPRKARIEIRHNTHGPQRWWVALVGANGETMMTSERYDNRSKAVTRAKRHVEVMQMMCWSDIVDAA